MGLKAQLVAAATMALLSIAQPGFAQTAQPHPATPAPVATGAQAGEVLVTAQRRSESVQRVPETVTVLSGKVLARQNVRDLFQAVTLVPGVVFSRFPDDGLALTFRGLGTAARPQAFEQSIALFTDGVFMGKGRLYTTLLFDNDRIEFIKGTQSTLLGKNASLGAISVVNRQPGDAYDAEASVGYEFVDGGYTTDAATDLPVNDKISIRLAAHYNDLNGWVHNDITNHNGPEHKDLGLRAIVRADVTDKLRLTAFVQDADDAQIGASYQLVGAIPSAYGDGLLNDHTSQFTSLTSDGDTHHDTQSQIAYLKGELQLGEHTLIAQTSYVGYKLHFIDDLDFSKDDTVNFDRFEHYSQVTQELRIQSPTGHSFEYMAGVFYLTNHWDSLEEQLWAVPAFPPPPDPTSGQLFNGPFSNHFVQDQTSYSGFASGTYHFTSALRLTGGLRVTREDKNVVYGRTNAAPFTIWNTIANPPFDPTPLRHGSNFLDGNVILQYDVTPDVMAYASFAHGSKAGGFVETNTIAVPPQFLVNGKVPSALVAAGSAIKDELTESYELGLKTTSFDRRLLFNIALFHIDIENFQDTVFTGGPLGFLTTSGPATSQGVELEAGFRATPELRLDGGFTYADATQVVQPINPATDTLEVNANGSPVFRRYQRQQAPKEIFNVNATYERPIMNDYEIQLNAIVRYRSSMFNIRQEEFPSPSLLTLDLTMGIESPTKRWGIDLVAKNVTNAISQDAASPSVDPRFAAFYGAYLAGPNPLRTIMLSVHMSY
jgi:iron complex outermembrane receptor protein